MLHKDLAEIFEKADAEVQVHYGRVVQPVAQKYAEFLKTLKVNKDLCDEQCIADQCFSTRNWVMNWTCVVNTCNCGLEDPQATMQKHQELEETVAQQHSIVHSWKMNQASQVQEAFRAYRLRVVTVTQEARRLIEKQFTTVFAGCDQQCFRMCNTYYGNDLYGYIGCASHCACPNNTLVEVNFQ